ncbi:MAG: glucokinase [Pseudomonadota bacterium]
MTVDIGGTFCRLSLANADGLLHGTDQLILNSDYYTVEELLRKYLNDFGTYKPDAICAGVAGPVANGVAQLTNHEWCVNGPRLAAAFDIKQTVVLNDLQAQAYALDDLNDSQIETLVEGDSAADGPRMTMGLGTGCNIAVAYRMGKNLFVSASESGHTTLPDAPEYRAFFDHLRQDFPHLPIEAALSGPGLTRLHTFLSGDTRTPREIIATQPTITLECFARLLGMAMGNLALSHMATGGIYLIGGLARAVAPHLFSHGLHAPFCDRGPYRDIMVRMPIHVVLDDTAALLGCARYLRQVDL